MPAKDNPGQMTCQHQWDLPCAWKEVALQPCSLRSQPSCTHTHTSLTQVFSHITTPAHTSASAEVRHSVSVWETGPPRAIECETERELLQTFSFKSRQSKKHSKHKLWPCKTWKWKVENYFKHTDNYEPHVICGSAFINISERLSLYCMATKTQHSEGCFLCKCEFPLWLGA